MDPCRVFQDYVVFIDISIHLRAHPTTLYLPVAQQMDGSHRQSKADLQICLMAAQVDDARAYIWRLHT